MSLPYEVIVLKEGYAYSTDAGEQKADGTITLVKGPKNILVDTGSPWDRQHLIDGLSANGLGVDDIHYVVGTHGHSDHIGNLNLFSQAIFIVSYDICKGDTYITHDFAGGVPYRIDDEVEVMATPGHTGSDVSVVVRNTTSGTIVVAGDLFECEADLKDESIWRECSEKPDSQEKFRAIIYNIADVIVPGHGPMFKVTR